MNDIRNRKDIELLVDTFYKSVLEDERINYFFTEVAQLNFEKHMPKMYDFWEATLFHKPTYAGNALKVHKGLHEKSPLKKKHFDIWLHLFKQTVDDLFKGDLAELAKKRAQSIAMVMQLKMNGEKQSLL